MKTVPGIIGIILVLVTSACGVTAQIATPTSVPTAAATFTAAPPPATDTPQPTPTITPIPTFTPLPGVTALDFFASLCQADWMNGAEHLKNCPDLNADHSGGYAAAVDPATEGLPAGTPVLLTIPAWNGNAALFLRYPTLAVQTGDQFRATLRCQSGATCDVQYALEYFDAKGKYHSEFAFWSLQPGTPAVDVVLDLSLLAGQSVDFVLALRPNNDTPQLDKSLWIAPQIFRPNP